MHYFGTTIIVLTTLVFITQALLYREPTDACMKCICDVEGCGSYLGKCGGDDGRCGPYQINQDYFNSCEMGNQSFTSCAKRKSCSEECVKKNLIEWGESCIRDQGLARNPRCEDFARVHSRGPKGCLTGHTDNYWSKVQSCCVERTGCDRDYTPSSAARITFTHTLVALTAVSVTASITAPLSSR